MTAYVVLVWQGKWNRPYPSEIMGPHESREAAERFIYDPLNRGPAYRIFEIELPDMEK